MQPIVGGAPRQLTRFTDKDIADFAWSPDGARLAITREVAQGRDQSSRRRDAAAQVPELEGDSPAWRGRATACRRQHCGGDTRRPRAQSVIQNRDLSPKVMDLAARRLGLSRKGLYLKRQRLGL